MPVVAERQDDGDDEARAAPGGSQEAGPEAAHAPVEQPQVHEAAQCAHPIARRRVLFGRRRCVSMAPRLPYLDHICTSLQHRAGPGPTAALLQA